MRTCVYAYMRTCVYACMRTCVSCTLTWSTKKNAILIMYITFISAYIYKWCRCILKYIDIFFLVILQFKNSMWSKCHCSTVLNPLLGKRHRGFKSLLTPDCNPSRWGEKNSMWKHDHAGDPARRPRRHTRWQYIPSMILTDILQWKQEKCRKKQQGTQNFHPTWSTTYRRGQNRGPHSWNKAHRHLRRCSHRQYGRWKNWKAGSLRVCLEKLVKSCTHLILSLPKVLLDFLIY